jgi:hypothetical protein
MMVTKVQKWGNSQGLRLSKQVLISPASPLVMMCRS